MIEIEKPEGLLKIISEEAIMVIDGLRIEVAEQSSYIHDWFTSCEICGESNRANLVAIGLKNADTPVVLCRHCLQTIAHLMTGKKISPSAKPVPDSESFKIGYREGYRDGFKDNYELHD